MRKNVLYFEKTFVFHSFFVDAFAWIVHKAYPIFSSIYLSITGMRQIQFDEEFGKHTRSEFHTNNSTFAYIAWRSLKRVCNNNSICYQLLPICTEEKQYEKNHKTSTDFFENLCNNKSFTEFCLNRIELKKTFRLCIHRQARNSEK